MKKILFILMLLLIAGIVASYAQCGKKQILTSSKTEYLDASGNVTRVVDEASTIEFDKSTIIIVHGDNQTMTGTIKSDSCSWKIPFKEGKSIIKALISDQGGEARNVTITIEGIDGKISFLAEAEERPDRKIRVVIDKFEEKK